MMKKIISFLLLGSIFLTFFSCSSQTGKLVSPTVKEADKLYRTGKLFALKQDYKSALRTFEIALDRYSLVDNVDGAILSQIAIIGVLAQTGDENAIPQKIVELSFLIENTVPEYKPHLLLLELELAYLDKDYDTIIAETMRLKIKDKHIESQILCYRMLARLGNNLTAKSEFRRLKRNSKALQKSYRKNKSDDLGVYSFVNYTLGYYLTKKENWKGAIQHFNASLEADKTYDNASGIGKNLYYLAVAYHNLDHLEQAKIHYERALNIFKQLGDKTKCDAIEKKLNML